MVFFRVVFIFLFFLLHFYKLQAEPLIKTIFGIGDHTYNGDGWYAVNTSLNYPMSVCVDEFGKVYIADTMNNRIRMIDESGVAHTVAGNGKYGMGILNREATEVPLAHPIGIAVETINKEKKRVRIFISDTKNNRILVVNAYGVIKLLAGTGRFGYGVDNGKARNADFAWPSGISLDEYGNVYIADTFNHRIRVIYNPFRNKNSGLIAGAPQIKNPVPGYIYTIAGTGTKGYNGEGIDAKKSYLSYPADVWAVSGVVFFSDKGNHLIRMIDKNGKIHNIAGIPTLPGYDGDMAPATEERINSPEGIWSDGENVYFADKGNHRIRKVNIKDNSIITFAGIGKPGYQSDGSLAIYAAFNHPVDIFGNGKGDFFVVDWANSRVRIIEEEKSSKKSQSTERQ